MPCGEGRGRRDGGSGDVGPATGGGRKGGEGQVRGGRRPS